MGLFDDDDNFGGKSPEEEPLNIKSSGENTFQESSFDRSIVDKINPLIKVDVINKKYNLGKLLEGLGYDISGSNMYCPFHPDEMTGKPSAKYHADTDRLYCFSENKSYSAYHAIKLLYGLDVDKVFRDAWAEMSLDERHSLMDKYDDVEHSSGIVSSEWDKYKKLVLDKFKSGEVSYKQYKNALYKVLLLIDTEERQVGEDK